MNNNKHNIDDINSLINNTDDIFLFGIDENEDVIEIENTVGGVGGGWIITKCCVYGITIYGVGL
jgi:hypothetical protein